jgi:hypothetical protein
MHDESKKTVLIVHQDASQTIAVDQHTALVYWYGTLEDDGNWTPDNPELFKVYRGPATVFHEGQQFIDQMVSCVERHYGKTPPINRQDPHLSQCETILEFLFQNSHIHELHFAESHKDLPIKW